MGVPGASPPTGQSWEENHEQHGTHSLKGECRLRTPPGRIPSGIAPRRAGKSSLPGLTPHRLGKTGQG